MEGVEHLGKYVFEMTRAKVEALKAGGPVVLERDDGGMRDAVDDEDADRVEEVPVEEEGVGPEEPEEVPV
jgi:intron-binding protein aquarius